MELRLQRGGAKIEVKCNEVLLISLDYCYFTCFFVISKFDFC